MNKFRIVKKMFDRIIEKNNAFVLGTVENFAVERIDGKSFRDGVVSYNFELEDWQLAIDCAKQLEKESEVEE